jgi:hypothetical protein
MGMGITRKRCGFLAFTQQRILYLSRGPSGGEHLHFVYMSERSDKSVPNLHLQPTNTRNVM